MLKPEQHIHYQNFHGMNVKFVYASQLQYVLWEVHGDIIPIKPVIYNSHSNEGCTKVIQVPLISSTAVFMSKFQSLSADALYISSWGSNHNWIYCLLSRLQTLDNVFVGKYLHPTNNFMIPERLTNMLNYFDKTVSPPTFDYRKLPNTLLISTETQTRNKCHKHFLNVN